MYFRLLLSRTNSGPRVGKRKQSGGLFSRRRNRQTQGASEARLRIAREATMRRWRAARSSNLLTPTKTKKRYRRYLFFVLHCSRGLVLPPLVVPNQFGTKGRQEKTVRWTVFAPPKPPDARSVGSEAAHRARGDYAAVEGREKFKSSHSDHNHQHSLIQRKALVSRAFLCFL